MKKLSFAILLALLVLTSVSVKAGYPNTPGIRVNGLTLDKSVISPGHAATISSFSMTGFLANYTGNAVVLNWTTTMDPTKDHFEVERSTDGILFKHAGTVKVRESQETSHVYVYSDEAARKMTASKDLFYRLKVVDVNGHSVYSKVLIVRVYKTKALQMISATPNPVFNDIHLNIQLNENAYMVMKVVDDAGMEVLRKSARGTRGENNVVLEGTSRLRGGTYFLEVIINSNERMTMKLIKD